MSEEEIVPATLEIGGTATPVEPIQTTDTPSSDA